MTLFLIVWLKTGKIPPLQGALVGGAVNSLVLTPLVFWQFRVRAIRMSIRLEEDRFVVSGTASHSGTYSELVGFALAGDPELRYLLLLHPEGRHLSMGLEPALDVAKLREFLLTRLPEIAPEEAPEPKLW
ncbi:MAG: hypothetical protein EOP87_15925 [Verrucomicrobiaceae bacterium]|nr:MAG: hypothetical protein EOP87_15925 [Verrucomicrobiaceae bacterium]